MAKQKVRLSAREANWLSNLLKDAVIIVKGDGIGYVTRITKGGIQVLLPGSKTIRPYPLYDSFVSGTLRLKETSHQEEMMRSLREAAKETGVAVPSKEERAVSKPSEP